MTVSERLQVELDRLLKEGQQLLSSAAWDGRQYRVTFPPMDAYIRFRTEALNLVRRTCGADSDHYRTLQQVTNNNDSANNSYYTWVCVGAVEAARNDFARGLLFDVRALVSAEIFGDFLEQAEYLVTEGFFPAAVSLAGAVLEDALRRLCDASGIPVPERTKIDTLNAGLAKAGVYDKLIQKRITAVADLRNTADHGHFDRVSPDEARDMVLWVRRFVTDHVPRA